MPESPFTVEYYQSPDGDEPVRRWIFSDLDEHKRRGIVLGPEHAHGSRVTLLLAAYDKGADPSKKRQQREIATARSRLRDFRSRRKPRRP